MGHLQTESADTNKPCYCESEHTSKIYGSVWFPVHVSHRASTLTDRVVLRSAANPTIRHVVKLRDNRSRRKANRVLVDGWRETCQAIQAGLEIVGLYVSESLIGETALPDATRSTIEHATKLDRLIVVTDALMDKIGYGQACRGVVAEFARPEREIGNLNLPNEPLILVLDRIEKPGNVGAVFRCADAAGIDAILLSDCVDLFNPNAIRSSLGAVFRVPCAEAGEVKIEAFLASRDIRGLAARVESSASIWETDLTGPVAIILGSEAFGLEDRWTMIGKNPVPGVRIPMAGKVDSLNVSVSAAILTFEAVRQRG